MGNSYAAAGVLFFAVTAALAQSPADWRASTMAWRANHEKELLAPEGWLTVVGLDWLKPGDNSIGEAADNRIKIDGVGAGHLAVLHLEGEAVDLRKPAEGFPDGLTLDGVKAAPSPISFDGGHASKLRFGGFTFLVIHRGTEFALRTKNDSAPARLHFAGLRWYAPDAAYRVTAQWVPYATPRTVTIQNVVGIGTPASVPGEARLTLKGQSFALLPVVEGDHLFFVLRDLTSKTTTYPASRFLYSELPDHGLAQPGTVVLDFNQLVNPPCAFTAYATCPLPLEANKLKAAIAAGEMRYPLSR